MGTSRTCREQSFSSVRAADGGSECRALARSGVGSKLRYSTAVQIHGIQRPALLVDGACAELGPSFRAAPAVRTGREARSHREVSAQLRRRIEELYERHFQPAVIQADGAG